MTDRPQREVIFEITRLGEVQRVAAIDVETGTEVVIQAPANAALVDVRALALRKLERALGEEEPAPVPPKPGTLI
ncbi:MAG: hypothetical protein ABL883_04280 [Terricaulis sp.]